MGASVQFFLAMGDPEGCPARPSAPGPLCDISSPAVGRVFQLRGPRKTRGKPALLSGFCARTMQVLAERGFPRRSGLANVPPSHPGTGKI